jgi:hypothetical protein
MNIGDLAGMFSENWRTAVDFRYHNEYNHDLSDAELYAARPRRLS